MTIPVGALGDISSALFAVIGVLAALRHRDHTGLGQYVDIAMLDAVVAMTDVVTNFWSLGVRPEPGKGLQIILDGFRASDGYVVVQVVREHQFEKLAELVGRPEWNDDPRFATRAGWAPNLERVIRPAVDAWASRHTKLEAPADLTRWDRRRAEQLGGGGHRRSARRPSGTCWWRCPGPTRPPTAARLSRC